jgi:hypothetical protein
MSEILPSEKPHIMQILLFIKFFQLWQHQIFNDSGRAPANTFLSVGDPDDFTRLYKPVEIHNKKQVLCLTSPRGKGELVDIGQVLPSIRATIIQTSHPIASGFSFFVEILGNMSSMSWLGRNVNHLARMRRLAHHSSPTSTVEGSGRPTILPATTRAFHPSSPLLEKKKGFFSDLRLIFSKERMDQRQKELEEEVNKGQFYELKEMQKTGGKIFEADKALIPADGAKIFPHVEGFNLENQPYTTTDMLGGKVLAAIFLFNTSCFPCLIFVLSSFQHRLPW